MTLRNSAFKLHRVLTFDPEQYSTKKFRKRLLSEHQGETCEMKRTKKDNFNFISLQTDVILETSYV